MEDTQKEPVCKFFYSKDHAKHYFSLCGKTRLNKALINGKEVEYTCMFRDSDMEYCWDYIANKLFSFEDYEYLGEGTVTWCELQPDRFRR